MPSMRVCAQWYGQGGGSGRLPRAAIKRGGKNGDDKGELLGAVKLQSAPDADNPCYVAVCVNCFEWHCYTDGSYSKYTIHRTGVNVCHAASDCQINKNTSYINCRTHATRLWTTITSVSAIPCTGTSNIKLCNFHTRTVLSTRQKHFSKTNTTMVSTLVQVLLLLFTTGNTNTSFYSCMF